ncbi:hypothetical protein [Neisseria sicca]|uniref:hypothetical protein n=1 Tax=Neisseria sicca TaxID=490 RepID=UPI001649E81D|nr:hypothetical protein [Neisseria sicca]
MKEVMLDMNKWGIEETFEWMGKVKVMGEGLESAQGGWGEWIMMGVGGVGEEISSGRLELVRGGVWKGCGFGGVKGGSEVGKMVED